MIGARDKVRSIALLGLFAPLIFCAAGGLSWAAPAESGSDGPEDLQREVLKTWTTDQGLPQNFVTAIAQTPDGFLWVGTNGGLARFDGEYFRSFLKGGPAGMRHSITHLVVDDAGTLWIGGSTGLFSYRQGRFESFSLGRQDSGPVEGLVRGAAGGRIWAWTKETLFRVSGAAVAQVSVPVPLGSVRDIQQDKQGKLWIADGNQIDKVDAGRIETVYPLANGRLVYIASDGSIFAGDGHKLFRLERSGFVAQPKQGPDEFVQMLIDRGQRVWMASGGLEGISRFADGKLETLSMKNGLASNDARVLFEDRDGDLWIGTISGLQRLHRGRFTRYTAQDGLPPQSQYDAIFEDKQHAIWAGTLDAGVWRFADGRWHGYGVAQGVRRGQVRGFADGDSGPVVAIADYGLFAYDKGRFRKLPGMPAGYISCPVRTADGRLWFSVLHRGVYRLGPEGLTFFGAAEGLTDDMIWTLATDGEGGIWAGGKTGAYHWDGTRWNHEVPSTNAVDAIALPRGGGVLIGTANGLLYRNGRQSWSLTQEDGLPGDAVYSVREDTFGDLWLSTAHGICRIPHEQVEALKGGSLRRVTPEVFTEGDGLKSRGVLPLAQVTGVLSHDGKVWFATESGPVAAQPEAQSQALPEAVLDGIAVDDVSIPVGDVKVEPGRHRLAFAFTAPDFTAPEQMRFRYRLQGWKSDWVDAGGVREASYMGLAPGSYSFEVQAANRTGQWGPASPAVAVELEPFFWQTRWFLTLVVALVGGLLIETTRRRTLQRAEKLNLRFQERSAERERIALQIHDTFIQDLTGTALQLELVELQLGEDPEIAQRSLSHLAARIREMVARSREIVSNLHSMAGPQFSLMDLLTYVEAEFRLAETPEYVLTSEGTPRALHPFLRDEVYSICREAIANAFRHAAANRIEVTIAFLPRKLVVSIEDDGVGMSEAVRTGGLSGHFGLSGMQAHARRIDGRLQVESAPGVGTKVTLEARLAGPIAGGFGCFSWRRFWSRGGRSRPVSESREDGARGSRDSV